MVSREERGGGGGGVAVRVGSGAKKGARVEVRAVASAGKHKYLQNTRPSFLKMPLPARTGREKAKGKGGT